MKRTTESTKHTALFLLPHLIHDALSYGDDQDCRNLRESYFLSLDLLDRKIIVALVVVMGNSKVI